MQPYFDVVFRDIRRVPSKGQSVLKLLNHAALSRS